MYLSKLLKIGSTAAVGLLASSLAFGQVTVGVRDATGQAGQQVEVEVYFVGNGAARTYQFDITADLTSFEGGVAGVDVSRCIESAPTQPIENCVIRNAPNDDTVRLGQASFTDPMPNIDPIGVILYTISSTATAGDVIDLTITDWDVENVPAVDVQTVHGTITVVDTDAVLAIAPADHDFGTQDVNDGAQTFNFTLSNDGENDSLEIGTASVGGAPFSVSGNCDGEELAPGGTCVVTVTFDPASAGTFSDTLSVTSDANNVSADLDGQATATANIVVTPPFGPVNLGSGAPGDTLTANGSVQNTGSASADLSCTLTGDPQISTDPSPLAATIGAGETVDFSLACALPELAEEGDTFSATLSCDVDGELAGTHEISCGVSTFEPLPVPTMQAWSLALFALMMLLAGAIGIRFFRA